jgi:L-alanine-DL-glutamate epimerase-like enolase superfamily enzyme
MIVAVRAQRLDVRMKKPFGIAGGVQTVAANVLVEVELASGVRGIGEGAPFPAFNGETQDAALAAIAALDLAGERGDTSMLDRVPVASAACAIETAIADARAREQGVSLRAVFGGAETTLVTDVTITTGSVEDAAREARAFASFATLKIKVGGSDVDRDAARILAVRAARPDARILLDANGGLTIDEAVRLASLVAQANVALFEQPVAPGSWEALAEVRSKTRLRVAADESIARAPDVDAARGSVDAVNVKIMKSGLVEGLAIAKRARALGLELMIGGMVETRLAMGTSACLAAGLGGFAYVDLDTPLFLAEDPFAGGYVQNGETLDLTGVVAGHGLTVRRPDPLSDAP